MQFVVKDRIWPALGYEPHDGQRDIHCSNARHRVVGCGRRFGKSTLGGHELVPEAVYTASILRVLEDMGKRRRFWIVGPDYSDVDKEFRVLWDDAKRLQFPMDSPGSYYNPQGGNYRLSLWDGRYIVEGKSAKNPDSLDGEGLFGVMLVEAAKLKPHIWGKYIRPALMDEGGWSLSTSTPEGKNWFYKMWQRGQDPSQTDYASWRMPSWENTHLFPGGRNDPEILASEHDMSTERFNQEIGADFTDFVGRVFKDFDEELHVTDVPYRPDLPLVMATDYGWTNPFVALAIQWDVFNNVYVIGEYRVTHKDTTEIATDLARYPMFANCSELYPEPADPDDTNILSNRLHMKVAGNTGGELKWRLELIRQWLQYDPESEGHPASERKPRLFIDRHCTGQPLGDGGLIREMLDYKYPETKEESVKAFAEHPVDKDNHGPEALGRFFRGHFGGPTDSAGGARARIRRVRVKT